MNKKRDQGQRTKKPRNQHPRKNTKEEGKKKINKRLNFTDPLVFSYLYSFFGS
jgi:hypothetical protein